jgi:Xaa-Pro aminopeptidase
MVLSDVGRRTGPVHRLAVAQRTWARTVIELTRAFANPQLVDGSALTEPIRAVKGADELAALGRACRIADEAMAAVTARLRPGVTTVELLHELEYQLHVRGSSAVPFPTAVFAMGPDPSDEPYAVSDKPIESGMAVSFDFGAVCDGYCSDFGRTVFIGEPTEEARRVYEVVIAAQEAGIAAVHEGVPAADVDGAARAVIRDAGFEAMFHSRVGHSVGLDTHERPFIAPADPTPLRPGMTFTVEPSVFWPGHTGVRVEDIVVCEPAGGRKLNRYRSEIVVV